jgi:AraC-like DNA-binding protein
MARPKQTQIEYRNYLLPAYFPIILLSGDNWRISDVPAEKLHFHNCLEIGLCESDSGTLQFAGISSHFTEGDVTIIASDVPHTTYSAPGTASKWSYLFVDVEELFVPYFPLEVITGGETLRELLRNYHAILSRESQPEIHGLVCAIIREMQQKNLNFQFSVRGLMLSLMMKLMNLYASSDFATEKQMHENSLSIAPALFYIRQNYMLDFPMDELAGLCDMSPTHFRRTFSSIMGFGPLEYVNRVRISHATALLRTTETPILDISEEIGFRSVSSFNRHFMETIGMTPMQYRKQMSCVRDQSILKCTGWLTPEKI